MVLAGAAAPERADVVVEWELTGDPATCPPDSQVLAHSNMRPLERGLTAELVVGASRIGATTMVRRAYHSSHGSIGAIDAISFPRLPTSTETAELCVSEGAREWRVGIGLVPGEVNATALAPEVARDGVAVRASAVAKYGDEVIVELEIEAARQIRRVGAPIPIPTRFSSTSEEDQRARMQEHRRVFGERSRPITLVDEHGGRTGEAWRLVSLEPQQSARGQPYVSRFIVAFGAPSADAGKTATLVVPFVELNDLEPSVTVDLRDVPLDLDLGEHHFRVISAERDGPDKRTVVVKVAPSASSPRFTQPARMHGVDAKSFAWNLDPSPGDTISLSTVVGDPPIVTFTGAVLRVDGPLRLEIPLV